tara:strand:+ start:881 stop:1117 length:237 start_codon:yes stop_codon:yes gene_type:complete
MTIRIWTKPETQETIKALRVAGYTIPPKKNGWYQTDEKYLDNSGKKRSYFTAMEGISTYMVNYHPELLKEPEDELYGI